jgi:mRNA interferase RelE/StbE
MIYELFISKKAQKDLEDLSIKDIKRIDLTFEKIKRNPFVGKKLVGDLKGYYSIRVWPLRVLYEIKNKKLIILVLRIAHRKEVYK